MFRFFVAAAMLAPAGAFAADAMIPLTVRDVKVGGEIGRRVNVTIHNNLLALDAEKDFLVPFEKKAEKSGYIGLGKLIMSAARFAAYSGDPKVMALERRLVSRTIAAQERDGYIGMFAAPSRVRELWDVHEIGYLVAGLTTDYEFFREKASLEAAKKAANYVIAHWNEIPPDWVERTQVATNVAVTGLERSMLALYRATGDARYLNFVVAERALPEWNLPIIVGRRPGIEGHIYAYTSRSLAQLELYRITPAGNLRQTAELALAFLKSEGMAVTGGAGQWEVWTDDQDGRGELAESCATAYQLRLYDSLLRLNSSSRVGDLMERTIFNTLFAAQSPDGRRIRYYSPIEGPRVYHPGDTYCCPGNYRRIISELPEMIYYRWNSGLAVNLYTASQAKLEVAGGARLLVKQETDYPKSGDVDIRLELDRPAKFPVRLRIPAWARLAAVSVNGEPLRMSPQPGSFAELEREWKTGDTIQLRMPMSFRLVLGRERQAGRVAVMRGPLVLCLNPSQDAALGKLDGADLGRYTLDPAALELVTDTSVHPDGIACRAGAWKPGYGTERKHDARLLLTEFADPGGRAVYFRLRDMSVAVADELRY